jgi:RmlD substrate binding domain
VLTHLLDSPQWPTRTVVIGAGGFVGGAIARRVAELGGQVLSLSREQIDLLAPDGAQRLASLLRPEDAVVAAAARAPCKDMSMMIDNMIMTKAMIDGSRCRRAIAAFRILADGADIDTRRHASRTRDRVCNRSEGPGRDAAADTDLWSG